MADKRIKIGVDVVKGDTAGLSSLRTEITKTLNLLKNNAELKIHGIDGMQTEIAAATQELEKFQSIINKSFNYKLNSVDIIKFRQEIAKSDTSLDSLRDTLYSLGPTGVSSFRNLTTSLLSTKTELRETHALLDKMRETLSNTVRWSIASTALNSLTGSVQKAWSFAKSLDKSLTDIRVVTNKSAEDMDKFAMSANKAAKSLGAATNQYAKASLIYYQQGLSDSQVEKRAATTLKAANITRQGAEQVSEQLTAIWNGYKVSAQDAELYIDKVSAVAASTAADLQEMAEGMQKVASAANSMGVDIDQLNAMLSTIVSVTREDSSAVGTALKTIFSRMGDLKVEGIDEFGTSLGDVSGQLQTMGINILDQEGELRNMGVVIEEVAKKWKTWTGAQQQAAAVAIAGKRQYNNLIALFENWDMYESAKMTSQTGAGTLQKQNEIYLDSVDAKLNQIQTSAEGLYNSLINTDGFKKLFEIFSGLIGLTDQLVQGIGGGASALGGLAMISTRLLSGKVGEFLKSYMVNRQQNIRAKSEAPKRLQTAEDIYNTSLEGESTIKELINARKAKSTVVSGSIEEQQLNARIEELKASKVFEGVEDKTKLDNDEYLQELQSESRRNIQIASMEKERYTYSQYLSEEARKEFDERIISLNDYYDKLNSVNLAIEQEDKRHQEVIDKSQQETAEKQEKFYNKQIATIEDSIKTLQDKDAKELKRLKDKAEKEAKTYEELEASQIKKYNQAQDTIRLVTKDDTHNFTNARSRRQAFGKADTTISALEIFKKDNLTISTTEKEEIIDSNTGKKRKQNRQKDALELKREAEETYSKLKASYASILNPEDLGEIQSIHADKIASIKKATSQEDARNAIQAFYNSIATAIKNTIAETKNAIDTIRNYDPKNSSLMDARAAAEKAKAEVDAAEKLGTTLTEDEQQQVKDLQAAEKWLNDNLKDVDISTLDAEGLHQLKEKVKATKALTEKQQDFVKALIEEKETRDEIEKEKHNKTKSEKEKEQRILSAQINQSVDEWDAKISEIKYQMIGEGITEVAGAVAGLAGTMNTLINITDIWENENLTAWEKFSQTIIAAGGGFIGLVSSVSQFNTGLNKMIEGLHVSDISVKRNLAALNEEQSEYQQSILVKRIYIKLTEEEKNELDNTTKERIENNESLDEEQLKKFKEIAGEHKAQTFGDKVKGIFTKDFWKQKGADIKGKFVGADGKLTGGAIGLGVTAAIAGTAMVVKAIYDVTQIEKKAVAQAEENLSIAQENLQVAEQRAQTIRDNLSAYEETAKSLNSLVTGTEKWREATAALTDEILSLISLYPELANYTQRSADGVLTLTEEGKRKAEEMAQQQEANARAAMYGAAADKASADRTLAYTNFLRENDDIDNVISGFETDTTTDGKWSIAESGSAELAIGGTLLAGGGAALIGAKIGGAIGTAAGGPIGAAVGAAIGLAIGGLTMLITEWTDNNEDRERQVLDGVAKVIAEDPSIMKDRDTFAQALKTELNLDDDALISALYENKEETLALAKQMEASRKAQALQSEQEAYNFLVGKYGDAFESSKFANQIARTQAINGDVDDKFADQVKWMTDAEIQEQYAEMTDASSVTNKFGGFGTYVITDAEGNKTSVDIDDKTARAALARKLQLEAEAGFSAVEQALLMATKDLDKQSQQAVANALTDNEIDQTFNNLTKAQVQQINDLDWAYLDILGMTEEQLVKLNGEYKVEWDKVNVLYGEFITGIQEQLGEKYEDQLTLQGAMTAGALNEKIGGEGSVYQSILNSLEGEDLINFINSLQDFDDYSDIDIFKSMLESFDLIDKIGTDTLTTFTLQIQEAFEIWENWDLAGAQETAKTINTILGKVKEFGDTIEASEYKELSSEAQKYFLLMADGTYALYKDAEEFYNLTRGEQLQSAANTVQGLKNDISSTIESYVAITNKSVSTKDQVVEALFGEANNISVQRQGADERIRKNLVNVDANELEKYANIEGVYTTGEKEVEKGQKESEINSTVSNMREAVIQAYAQADSLSSLQTIQSSLGLDEFWKIEGLSNILIDENKKIEKELKDLYDKYANYFTSLAQNKNIENFSNNLKESLDLSKLDDSYNEFLSRFGKVQRDYGTYADQIKTAQDSLTQLENLKSSGEISEEQYWEKLPEAIETSQAALENYYTLLDEINELYDLQVSYLEHINSLMDTSISLAKLRYGEDADISEFQAEQAENLAKITETEKLRYNQMVEEYNSLVENAENDSELTESFDKVMSAAQGYTQALYAEAELLHERYVTNIEQALERITESYGEGLGLKDLGNEWDWVTAQSDRYLDSIDAVYNIQKLSNKFENAALKATEGSLKRINDLRDKELKLLKEKDKVSQYELDRVEKLLELEQARIALEQSQSSTSQMQLVRGADGSYSYQYTQDEDAVAEARAAMEAKEQELLNSSKEAYEKNAQASYAAMEKYQELLTQFYTDGSVSKIEQQQLNALIQEAQEYAQLAETSKQNLITDLNESSIISLEGMTAEEWIEANISPTTTGVAALVEEIANSQAPFAEMRAQVQNMTDEYTAELDTIQSKLKDVNAAQDTFVSGLTNISSTLGDNQTGLAAQLGKLQEKLKEISEKMPGLLEKLSTAMDAYVNRQGVKMQLINGDQQTIVNKMVEAMASDDKTVTIDKQKFTANELSGMVASRADSESTKTAAQEAIEAHNTNYPDNQIESKTAQTYGFAKIVDDGGGVVNDEKGMTYDEWKQIYTESAIRQGDTVFAREGIDGNYSDGGNDGKILTWSQSDLDSTQHAYFGSNGKHYAVNMAGGAIVSQVTGNAAQITFKDTQAGMRDKNQKTFWVRLQDLVRQGAPVAPASALTGGYTGEWGSEGKFLEVHEKELILNKTDTANILNAVDIVRTIETNALERIAMLLGNIGMSSSQSVGAKEAMQIDQNVSITAEFPNATDRNEIQEAFSDLVNLASQRAYLNKRS